MKLVHLVGFIAKRFVTMHGHMNVKFTKELIRFEEPLLACSSEAYIVLFSVSETEYSNVGITIRRVVNARYRALHPGSV